MSQHWLYKGFSLLLIVFCLELGLFLMVYPWTFHWQTNAIPSLVPSLLAIWNSDYARGAVSGLGILNVWVAVVEIYGFWHVAAPEDKRPVAQ